MNYRDVLHLFGNFQTVFVDRLIQVQQDSQRSKLLVESSRFKRKLATRRVFLLATIDFKWTNNKSKHISVVFLVRVSLWNRGPFCKYQYWPTTLAQCQAKGIDCPWDLMLANQHIVCGLNGSGTIQPWHRKKVCKTMCVSSLNEKLYKLGWFSKSKAWLKHCLIQLFLNAYMIPKFVHSIR